MQSRQPTIEAHVSPSQGDRLPREAIQNLDNELQTLADLRQRFLATDDEQALATQREKIAMAQSDVETTKRLSVSPCNADEIQSEMYARQSN